MENTDNCIIDLLTWSKGLACVFFVSSILLHNFVFKQLCCDVSCRFLCGCQYQSYSVSHSVSLSIPGWFFGRLSQWWDWLKHVVWFRLPHPNEAHSVRCHRRCFHLFIHYVLVFVLSIRISSLGFALRCDYVLLELMAWWFTKEIANFLAIHTKRTEWMYVCIHALMMHIPIECVLKQRRIITAGDK